MAGSGIHPMKPARRSLDRSPACVASRTPSPVPLLDATYRRRAAHPRSLIVMQSSGVTSRRRTSPGGRSRPDRCFPGPTCGFHPHTTVSPRRTIVSCWRSVGNIAMCAIGIRIWPVARSLTVTRCVVAPASTRPSCTATDSPAGGRQVASRRGACSRCSSACVFSSSVSLNSCSGAQ